VKFAFFYHSLVSDWNHGNAHFLRGILSQLISEGHEVRVFEPWNSWSRENLIQEKGAQAISDFYEVYPRLSSFLYDPFTIDLDEALDEVNVVLVHEWNDPSFIKRIGLQRKNSGSFVLFFHDTHHRSITDEQSIARYELANFDGVLAYGEVIRQRYLQKGWVKAAWTWHEAADVRMFYPREVPTQGDLIWVGNWGDDERTAELQEFLIDPVKDLNLRAAVYGVRYPECAIESLSSAGMEYRGWIANFRVPKIFGQYKVTLHIPRRPYVEALPGIPTIRPFEALASGIPLICSPWDDTEKLFNPGKDFLIAHNKSEMKNLIRDVLNNSELAQSLIKHGINTIQSRHTCAHRVNELMQIYSEFVPESEKVLTA
jgi:spore maturation protein CgeB